MNQPTALIPSAYSDECLQRAGQYIEDVLSGRVNVGRLERSAVERFERMVEEKEYVLDLAVVDRVFRFFSILRHSKTRQWSGLQLLLEGWQAFIILALFGLVRKADRLRVFRIAYIQIARKNGKSTFAAGIALYLLVYDDEDGAEVYSAATKRDQAKIVWKDAREMIRKSPQLAGLLDVRDGVSSITYLARHSVFLPVGADADTLDGLNTHASIIDELHAHNSRKMWDVMIDSMGSRVQPLQFVITTAGFDLEGICYEQRERAEQVINGVFDDPELFAFICELDDDDDWTAPENWRKANPNLGVSVIESQLRAACMRAQQQPSEQNNFRTKRLDAWVAQQTRFLSMEDWKACPKGTVSLEGRECYAGLDLASTRDLNALVLVFPPTETDPWALLPFFWCPESVVTTAMKERRIPYDAWEREGWLTATSGNVADYDVIRDDVSAIGAIYNIREIGYDPYNATQLVIQLQRDGFEMVQMRQGIPTLHAPTKEFEKLVVSRQIDVSKSPILRWMASNVSVYRDNNGNMKPTRENQRLKIDGIVAGIMGLGRAMADDSDADESDYAREKPMVLGG